MRKDKRSQVIQRKRLIGMQFGGQNSLDSDNLNMASDTMIMANGEDSSLVESEILVLL